MPNIREYRSEGDLRPTDRGIGAMDSAAQSTAIAGRSIQASYAQLGREIGSAVQMGGEKWQEHQARQEITKGMADIAGLQDNLTKSWTDVANQADPNDHGVRDRFLEVSEQAFGAFPSQFKTKQGQEWATQQIGRLRQHMFETTAADQAAREGSAIVQNLQGAVNRFGSTLDADPSQFTVVAGTLDMSLDALIKSSPNLDPAVAAKLRTEFGQQAKEELAHRALISAIDKDPNTGRQMLASGQFADYIDSTTHKALETYADAQERAAKEQFRADQAEARRVAKERADSVAAAITASVVQKDGSLAIPSDYNQMVMKYALLPEAEPGRVEAMLNFQRSITNELEKGVPAIDDPPTYSDFASRLMLDPDDPRFPSQKDIINARAAGRLSDKSYNFFMGALSRDPDVKQAHKSFQTFLSGYKGYITSSSMLKVDAYGDQRWMEFQRDAQQYHDWARQQGANEEAIRRDIANALPRYQYSQAQARAAVTAQARGQLKPLPPVNPAATVNAQPNVSVAAPPAVSGDRLEQMRKFLSGGGGAKQNGGVF